MTKRTDRPVENTEVRATRPRRNFVDDARDIMTVQGKDPDYQYRWVNDERGRINRMIEAGYDVVTDEHVIGMGTERDSGSANTMTVDRINGVKGVLMRIRNEFAEEDTRARGEALNRSEAALFRSEQEEDGRYGTLTKS